MNEDKAWVLKCIETSFTQWHFDGCQVLVDLFSKKYGDSDDSKKQLQQVLDDKIADLA